MEIHEIYHQRKINQEFFINVSNRKFNNKFKFPNLDLVWIDHKVKIECPIHGEILITPEDHLDVGCWACYLEPFGIII